MRIAFFSDNFYPEISGISDSLIILGKELSERGHSIRYYAPRYSRRNFALVGREYKEFAHNQNVSVKRIASLPYFRSPTKQARLVIPTGMQTFDIRRFKPDIIHTNSPFGVGFEALLAAKFLNIPLVGTNHTPIDEFIRYSPIGGKFIEPLGLQFYSWYYNQCAFVTAPSQSLLEHMKEHGFKKPHKALSNPIDNIHFTPPSLSEKNSARAVLSLTGDVLLYTGRLAREKNVDVVLKALAEVIQKNPQVILVITGHGPAEKPLKKLAHDLEIEKCVRFAGFVDDKTLALYYQAADMFVMMSTAETQCLGLMLAMASGMPSVVANARALPEYVGSDRGYIVPIGNYQALAEKILYLLEHKEIAQNMGEKAALFVQTLSIKNIANEWLRIYQSLI